MADNQEKFINIYDWNVQHSDISAPIINVGTGGRSKGNVYAFTGSTITVTDEEGNQYSGIPAMYDYTDPQTGGTYAAVAVLDPATRSKYIIHDQQVSQNILRSISGEYRKGVTHNQPSINVSDDEINVPYRFQRTLPQGKRWRDLTEGDINELVRQTADTFLNDVIIASSNANPQLQQMVARDLGSQIEHLKTMAYQYYKINQLTDMIVSGETAPDQKAAAMQQLEELAKMMKIEPGRIASLAASAQQTAGSINPADKFFLQSGARWKLKTATYVPGQNVTYVGSPETTGQFLASSGSTERPAVEARSGMLGGLSLPYVMAEEQRPTNIPVSMPAVHGPHVSTSVSITRQEPRMLGGGGGGSAKQVQHVDNRNYRYTRDQSFGQNIVVPVGNLGATAANPGYVYATFVTTNDEAEKNNPALLAIAPADKSNDVAQKGYWGMNQVPHPNQMRDGGVLKTIMDSFVHQLVNGSQDLYNGMAATIASGNGAILEQALSYLLGDTKSAQGVISAIQQNMESGGGDYRGIGKNLLAKLTSNNVITKQQGSNVYGVNWDAISGPMNPGSDKKKQAARSMFTALCDLALAVSGATLSNKFASDIRNKTMNIGKQIFEYHQKSGSDAGYTKIREINIQAPDGSVRRASESERGDFYAAVGVAGIIHAFRELLANYAYGNYTRRGQ